MGQRFLIANREKNQFLDPLILPVSEKFPAILCGDVFANALTLLVCRSRSRLFSKFKSRGLYTEKFFGSWYGDPIDLVGDSDQEAAALYVRSEYENISIEAAAMLFELWPRAVDLMINRTENGDYLWLQLLHALLNLENPPENIVIAVKGLFGESWIGGIETPVLQ